MNLFVIQSVNFKEHIFTYSEAFLVTHCQRAVANDNMGLWVNSNIIYRTAFNLIGQAQLPV